MSAAPPPGGRVGAPLPGRVGASGGAAEARDGGARHGGGAARATVRPGPGQWKRAAYKERVNGMITRDRKGKRTESSWIIAEAVSKAKPFI